MTPFLAEFIGTAILILLGNGAVANVVLNKSKGHSSGWIVISAGWGMAVFVAVFVVGGVSGAHINPAVTLAMAITKHKDFGWDQVPSYMLAQLAGAVFGACLVWLTYRQHFDATENSGAQLGCFSTGPAIRSTFHNFLTEVIATFMLVFGVLYIADPDSKLGALDALPVGLLVFAIGLSLGGPTGYAINPARDLGPRIAHMILPMRGKGDSDWGYSWIPVVGPLVGGALAAWAFMALQVVPK